MDKTISEIIRVFRAGNLSKYDFVIEVAHAVGMPGDTSFQMANTYAEHLLN